MRIAVSGASGFIGAALVPLLKQRGHEVTRLARGATPAGCDAVVHLANIAHTRASREELWRVNVEGTRRIAEAVAGNARLIYLSSAKALEADDDYGRSKRAAEQALGEISGLDLVVLRPPLVYGPGVRANFLALLRAIDRGWPLPLAAIHNRRSLVYLGNLCDAIARCVEVEGITKTYGVTDGEPVSTPALCRAIGEALGRPARLFSCPSALLELLPGMTKLTRSLEVDDAALRRDLGWSAPHSLAEGLRQTARWYRG